jgi:hypothetical protein
MGFKLNKISVYIKFISEYLCKRYYLNILGFSDDFKGSSALNTLVFFISRFFKLLIIFIAFELLLGP